MAIRCIQTVIFISLRIGRVYSGVEIGEVSAKCDDMTFVCSKIWQHDPVSIAPLYNYKLVQNVIHQVDQSSLPKDIFFTFTLHLRLK